MKIRKRFLFPLLLAGGFFAGPKASYEPLEGDLPTLNYTLPELDAYVQGKEKGLANLRPDNQSRIVWADSMRKTPFAVVYLHGWSASQEEGDPLHEEFAKRYGCNLYLPLLAGHGVEDPNSFATLTPKQLIDSAKEALAVGRLLGEQVILMSCSTGGTLSTYLAATYPDAVAAQLLYSPNIDLANPLSELLTLPWGKQIAYAVEGKQHSFTPPQEAYQYWTTTYSTDGLVCLKTLVEWTQTPDNWKRISQPIFMGYYYKNEDEQDDQVSVEEMHRFFKSISTPEDKKKSVAFPESAHHVVLSRILSKDLESVRRETFAFAENTLGLQPLNTN
jgi:pimeloyl-ACP methyl ester carboxylesterase